MNRQCQTLMRGAISKVLETMFFTTALFEGTDEEPQAGAAMPYCFGSHIVVHGDSAKVALYCLSTDRFARMITANFLGVGEDELTIPEIGDAMKELANMTAGEFVAAFKQGSWRLDIPEFEELKPTFQRYPGKDLACQQLFDEDGPLALVLCHWVEPGQ